MKNKLFPLYYFLFFVAVSVLPSTIYAQENNSDASSQGESVLSITSPTTSTVWQLPNTITLEWSTDNIGSEKNIRFFLIRDEMVAQELGIFPNTGSATDIKLAKNIGAGRHYQVMGIELFPDDKYNIAKFATPFFTIEKEVKNPPVSTTKEIVSVQPKPVQSNTISEAKPTKREERELKKKERKAIKEKARQENSKIEKAEKEKAAKASEVITNPVATNQNVVPEPPVLREEFVGRNITYVKDLTFNSTEIRIYVWDHGRQDGDIISIYLNGEPVLTKYYLTYWKKEIKIKVDPNKTNDLFLYAHNLGSAPPNTVSLKITDGTTTTEDIILNSDLKSCEAVSISVTK